MVRTLVVPTATRRDAARRRAALSSPMRVALGVQAAVFHALGVQRLERPQAHVQGHGGHIRSAPAASLQNLRREMQPRGGRGDRSALAGEDRLVALAVGGGIGPFDVGRQRDMADLLELREQVGRRRESAGCVRRIPRAPRSRLPVRGRSGCVRPPAVYARDAPALPNRARPGLPGAAERLPLPRSDARAVWDCAGRWAARRPRRDDRTGAPGRRANR